MRLTINDDLADTYLQALPTKGLLEPTIERVLTKAVPLVDEGAFVVSKDVASQLAYIMNGPPVGNDKTLMTQVQGLADIKIGQIRLKLHPSVLAGLKDRATRENKPLSELMQWAIDELANNLARFA